MDVLSEETGNEEPWELLYTDGLMIIAENEEDLQRRVVEWQESVETGGLKSESVCGKSTVDAIFALRQTVEKYREKEKGLHLLFIDLEKAYDRVPRQKGSALSQYVFDIVMDVITSEVREEVPWCAVFADDIVLTDLTREGVKLKLGRWREELESRGLKISRTKTEYMWTGGEEWQGTVKLGQEDIKRVSSFKYLGSVVSENAWMNWRKSSGILCDKRIGAKVKGKFYKSIVRPSMLYGAETWPIKKEQERRMEVAEMRILR
ncbi:uncharacterized protein LOC135206769 [Macrobrachium nipponense]|uniref:uncharacterized protein LOC135206769 n=1 Tax=Macrobrachium nipponense TaxID=159736 RepID=UPI0030C82929